MAGFEWLAETSSLREPFPQACRLEAFEYVRRQLPHLNSTNGLVRGVFGVALHALDDAKVENIEAELDSLAAAVNVRGTTTQPTALVTRLHQVLFEDRGFGGPPKDKYYNPLNSYLPAVFNLRYGLPITLGLVYKAVAERIGLEVEGIFLPGHFLVRVRDGQGWLIVDPFHRGRVLSPQEAWEMIGGSFASHDLLPIGSNKQWLIRVITNLVQVFEAMRSEVDLHAMRELLALVQSHG